MSETQTASRLEDSFRIVGATCDDNGEVIWLCKYFEPFFVTPNYDSSTRKKHWKEANKYFGKYLHVLFDRRTKRGVPEGNIIGTGFDS